MFLLFTLIMTIAVFIEAGALLSISLSLLLVVNHTTLPRIMVSCLNRGIQSNLGFLCFILRVSVDVREIARNSR
ncbi:hypothetical protein BKA69DRAFT_1108235 [Paraphysoderma sedebokerense]|nr:hypothetical protein BKA69DRAFT_1108235 [Paraphysoderma sedebokerense]